MHQGFCDYYSSLMPALGDALAAALAGRPTYDLLFVGPLTYIDLALCTIYSQVILVPLLPS